MVNQLNSKIRIRRRIKESTGSRDSVNDGDPPTRGRGRGAHSNSEGSSRRTHTRAPQYDEAFEQQRHFNSVIERQNLIRYLPNAIQHTALSRIDIRNDFREINSTGKQ